MAALLAAVLLAVSVPLYAFADTPAETPAPANETPGKQITFVSLPQGFSVVLPSPAEYTNDLFNVGSKLTFTDINDLNKKIMVGVNKKYDLHFDAVDTDDGYKRNDYHMIQALDLTRNCKLGERSGGKYWINNAWVVPAEGGTTDKHDITIGEEQYWVKVLEPQTDLITYYESELEKKPYAVIAIDTNADARFSITNGNRNYPYYHSNSLSAAIITVPYPEKWGSTSGDVQSYTTETTTITATPKPGYVFDHWEKDGEDIGGTSSMTVTTNGRMESYVAIFKPESEVKGVTVISEDEAFGVVAGDKHYSAEDDPQQTTITASANPGYVFSHWELSTDGGKSKTVSDSNSISVPVKNQRDVYTAFFDKMWTVTTEAWAEGYPSGKQVGTTTGDTDGYVNGQEVTQTTLQAYPLDNNYIFDHWELSTDGGATYTAVSNANPCTVHIVRRSGLVKRYRAVFIKRGTANGVYTAVKDNTGGTASGDALRNNNGQLTYQTTITATAKPGYVFDHWELTSSDGSSSNTEVSKDSTITVKVRDYVDTYTAVFTEEWGVKTEVSPAGAGTTSGDSKGYVNGQEITQTTLQAYPVNNSFIFDHWELSTDDGITYATVSNANPCTVHIKHESGLKIYRAVFVETGTANGVYTAVKTNEDGSTGGTASGDALRNNNGQLTYQTTITATAKPGYVFDHWEFTSTDGSSTDTEVSKDSTITVKVRDYVDTYTAVFTEEWGVKTEAWAENYSGEVGTTTGDTKGYVNGQEITQTTLQAYPRDNNYVFDHWELITDKGDPYPTVSNTNPYTVDINREDGMLTYRAIFVKMGTANGVYTAVKDNTGGTASGDALRNNNGQLTSQTTITATAKPGYYFDHWELTSSDGSSTDTEVSKDSTITVKVRDYVDTYTAVFTEEWCIKTEAWAKDYSGEGEVGTTTGDTNGYVNGQEVTQTTLQAYPRDNEYVFDHWELSVDKGNTYTTVSNANPCTVHIKHESGLKIYRAVFVKTGTANGVYTEVKVNADGSTGGTASGDALRNNNGQLTYQTTITATAKPGYVFDRWELTSSDGSSTNTEVSKDSTITVKVRDYVDTYTAVFAEEWGVKTEVSPAGAGTTSGDSKGYVNGQEITQTTLQAYPANNSFVFDHWECKGNHVSDANPYTVVINREDGMLTYTAVFKTLDESFGVFTEPDNPEHGSTSGDTLRRKDGQLVDQTTIQAIPANNEWVFDHWNLSNERGVKEEVSNANPYTVKVEDRRDEYTAVFIPAYEADGVYTTVSGEDRGTTSGDTLRTVNGQLVNETTIQAYPSGNEWVFDYWELKLPGEEPVKVSIANPYTVAVDDCIYVYIAHFRARNGVTNDPIQITGHATGIMDRVTKDKKRTFTVPVLGVDRNYVLALAEQAVAESSSRIDLPPYSSNSPRLISLRESLQLPEEKNADELKTTGFEFVTSDGEIVTVSDQAVSNEIRAFAYGVVVDKYGDLYNSEVLKMIDADVPVTFTDGKRTVIWSDTGAEKDDRLLIIQQGPMIDDRTITPVADQDGNITFSTSDFGGSRFILLKISFK